MDKALKQRLVGATVLIILTVIVLPMLLSGRSDTLQQGSRQIEIPQKPEEVSISKRRFPVGIPDTPTLATDAAGGDSVVAEFIDDVELEDGEAMSDLEPDIDGEIRRGKQSPVDHTLAAADDPADVSTAASEAQGQQERADQKQADEEQANEEQAGVLRPPAPQVAEQPEPLQQKAPAATSVVVEPDANKVDLTPIEDSDVAARYLVQVASFSAQKRADALAAELRSSGMTVEVDVVERTGGRLHRVRVGGFASRADADAAVARIKAGSKGLSPRVVDLRPADAAPVSTPSDPLVRWVVQVGSFSSAKSAESQVAQLRLAGLPAFSEKVTSSNGSVYKVRVGPEVDRDKATALARRIKDEQNLKGFVTTQD